MPIVVDASMAASWLLPDEVSDAGDRVLDAVTREGGLVPTLFWYEIRNLLIVGERRGRITPTDTQAMLQELSELPLAVDGDLEEGAVLGFARRHRLSVYDASYLELASRRASALATFDKALAAAAREAGVDLALRS